MPWTELVVLLWVQLHRSWKLLGSIPVSFCQVLIDTFKYWALLGQPGPSKSFNRNIARPNHGQFVTETRSWVTDSSRHYRLAPSKQNIWGYFGNKKVKKVLYILNLSHRIWLVETDKAGSKPLLATSLATNIRPLILESWFQERESNQDTFWFRRNGK